MTPTSQETCMVHAVVVANLDERERRNTEEHKALFRKVDALSSKISFLFGVLAFVQVAVGIAIAFYKH